MTKHAHLYTISDVDGNIRYVGVTINPSERFYNHLHVRKAAYSSRWIGQELRLGRRPIFKVFQTVPYKDRAAAEKYWIAYFKAAGCNLTNITEGGEGFSAPRTLETRAKIKAAWSAEKRAVARALGLATKHLHVPDSAATRRQKSQSHGGRPFKDQNGTIYYTCSEAASALGVSRSKVAEVLRGSYAQTKGFTFKHLELQGNL